MYFAQRDLSSSTLLAVLVTYAFTRCSILQLILLQTYTKMKAHDFYLQEALRNARRLNDKGGQLHRDTMQAARKARKLDFEVTIATQR